MGHREARIAELLGDLALGAPPPPSAKAAEPSPPPTAASDLSRVPTALAREAPAPAAAAERAEESGLIDLNSSTDLFLYAEAMAQSASTDASRVGHFVADAERQLAARRGPLRPSLLRPRSAEPMWSTPPSRGYDAARWGCSQGDRRASRPYVGAPTRTDDAEPPPAAARMERDPAMHARAAEQARRAQAAEQERMQATEQERMQAAERGRMQAAEQDRARRAQRERARAAEQARARAAEQAAREQAAAETQAQMQACTPAVHMDGQARQAEPWASCTQDPPPRHLPPQPPPQPPPPQSAVAQARPRLDSSLALEEEERRLLASLNGIDQALEQRRASTGGASVGGGGRYRAAGIGSTAGIGGAARVNALRGGGDAWRPAHGRTQSADAVAGGGASRLATRLRTAAAAACRGLEAVPCRQHGLLHCALCAAAAERPPLRKAVSAAPPAPPPPLLPRQRCWSAGAPSYAARRMPPQAHGRCCSAGNGDRAVTTHQCGSMPCAASCHLPPLADGRATARPVMAPPAALTPAAPPPHLAEPRAGLGQPLQVMYQPYATQPYATQPYTTQQLYYMPLQVM